MAFVLIINSSKNSNRLASCFVILNATGSVRLGKSEHEKISYCVLNEVDLQPFVPFLKLVNMYKVFRIKIK